MTADVGTRVTNVRDNTEVWGQHYTAKGTEIISLQQQISGSIAAKLRSGMNDSETAGHERGALIPEAYELFLKEHYRWNNKHFGHCREISYYDQAIAKDPGYALAYSGLADAYNVLPRYGRTPSEDCVVEVERRRPQGAQSDATLAPCPCRSGQATRCSTTRTSWEEGSVQEGF